MNGAGAASGVSKGVAAGVSIAYNVTLIALKVAAAIITGSVAILSEALNSTVDLVASVIAFVAVRRADEPADVEHPYGHEKVENVAASIEGVLIIGGAAFIISESVGRLVNGNTEVESLGFGIAVIAFSTVSASAVSLFLRRQARRHHSPALQGDAAHLGADALTSAGVLIALALVQLTGAEELDAAVAIVFSGFIIFTGLNIIRRAAGILVDEAPPPEEMDRIEAAIARARANEPEVVGYHKLRARTTGRRRYIELHVQFQNGTSLERAHEVAHELRNAIESDLGNAEVLIHAEPESSRHDPAESPSPFRAG
ncbi:MAG TPA: cation diffusion facilitator family transporter [Solirubrobacterales bacterium]